MEIANEIAAAILEAKRLYFVQFTPQAALQVLKNVIDKFKDKEIRYLADACSFSAFLHNYLGEWDDGESAASIGIKIDPNHVESYMGRGYARKHRGLEKGNSTSLSNAKEDFTLLNASS